MRRSARLGAALALGLLALVSTPAGAADNELPRIASLNPAEGGAGLTITVDVPPRARVDLAGVTATVGGAAYDAEAFDPSIDTRVARTTVIAIDTSLSMQGPKIEAAKAAAISFLDAVPVDVRVGVVTFDGEVDPVLAPTTDRDLAKAEVAGLGLGRGTLLFDGVQAAADLAGDDGQRSLLVLSDGKDVGSTGTADQAEQAVDEAGLTADVVSLQPEGVNLDILTTIAGRAGRVITDTADGLAATFAAQAALLSTQVGVTIAASDEALAQQTEVVVTLPSADGVLEATAFWFPTRAETVDNPLDMDGVALPEPDNGTDPWVLYGGVGVFALGLLVALVVLVPARPAAATAETRVATYTASARGLMPKEEPHAPPLAQQAAEALAGVLRRNRTLDQRITTRLEAAGSDLRSSEWVLVHAAAFVGFAVVGLLAGRGNVVVGLLFMLLGAALPWVYLGLRAARRRRAFDAALPETLQLLAGSLSAGLSLMQSVDVVVREGGEPVASAFRRVLIETRIGLSLEDALDGAAERFDSRDFRWVVMAIRIQRQVGGNLAELLTTVAATMREREYMRRQVAALAAEGKLSAVVLSVLPPIFLLYLMLSQRDYVAPLFTDPRGIVMIVGAALWLGVGVFWMSRLVKVEV